MHPKGDVNNRKDSENKIENGYILPLPKNTKINRDFSKKGIKIVKENSAPIDIHTDECSNIDQYSNSMLTPFITADKFDLFIIKEIIKDPDIQTLEISLKSEIPFRIAHRKRRLIESKVLQATYALDFEKLGLSFRFADIFADIKEDKVNDFVNQLDPSSFFTKNILKLIKIKTPSDGICIKTIYQNSDELFFLMDKVKLYPFISNVHFSEEIEVLGDNTVDCVLNMLKTDYK
ncbi:MAG: hypothetical protein P0116_14200 [Candidatus Nitrosocosmicus sp.]|nr:hypothetical protein [Candidatus Nitrosocosmicus sp.]